MYKFKQDLASAYFPDNSNVVPSESRESLLTMPSLSNVTEGKESASKRLAHEIHSNKPLLAALQATGYSRPRKILSPKQIQIIFSFLGEP
jgi:hypothetical protein